MISIIDLIIGAGVLVVIGAGIYSACIKARMNTEVNEKRSKRQFKRVMVKSRGVKS